MEEGNTAAIIQTLGACQVFATLSGIELKKVANLAQEKEYAAGATIFRQGEPANELLVLQEGKVALQRSVPASAIEAARSMTVVIVNPGELIGWSALIEPHVFDLTAVCLQPAKVLAIDGIKLRSMLGANHHIGYRILAELLRVVATRLDDTGQVLISERLLAMEPGRAS